MLTIEEIQAMSPEELAATNKKLQRKVAFHLIVKPILIAATVAVAAKLIENKLNISETN